MNLFYRIFNRFLKAAINSRKVMPDPEIGQLKNPVENLHRLAYRYEDASLPPEYHRSYTINVTPAEIHVSIDSYGNMLSKRSFAITKTKYQSFVAAMVTLNIKLQEETKSNGCIGGTSDNLDIHIGKDYEMKGYIYHCGGKTFGNLKGNVSKAVELFKALIPDLKNHLSSSIK